MSAALLDPIAEYGVIPNEWIDSGTVNFGTNARGRGPASWSAVGHGFIEHMARTTHDVELSVRVFMLAMARIDKHGHAQFEKGELEESLQSPDKATGKSTAPTTRAIQDAIAKLKRQRWICEDSNRRCIRLSRDAVQYPRGSGSPCRQH